MMTKKSKYMRRRKALWKMVKAGMISWSQYWKLRKKLEKEVDHEAG